MTYELLASLHRGLWAVCLSSLLGCATPGASGEPPMVDPVVFEAEIYPILLADCGFPGCHGATGRFFAVYGPGRTRLDPATGPYDPATPAELAVTYDRARSMVAAFDQPLLRKPLAEEAGGSSHEGDDVWGRALFSSVDDPRYQRLLAWTEGAP